jgi:lipopolysaccharide transport system ATP-binding protein
MAAPAVFFDRVWKKFRRGERHDSLRDLLPAMVRGVLGRSRGTDLEDREFWALRDVSFEVSPGQALGIIGANGAGKSTTLKLLTRILRPTRGACGVRGRLGALIEVAAGFHQDLTGRENVYLQGAIMGMKRAEIDRKLDEIVEFAGVSEALDTPVKRYSSGMNARLGFSIAAHLDPDVLIIDEVLSVGDVAFQDRCFQRMERFLRGGTAIVLVSHNLHAVSQLCGSSLLLNHGEVAAMGPSTDVIAKYHESSDRQASGDDAVIRVAVQGRSELREWRLEPGSTVSFRVDVLLRTQTRRSVLVIHISNVATGLYVYGANSETVGLQAISGDAGDGVSFDFSFDVNLARGVYALEVHLFDLERQRSLGVLIPAAQFTVVEMVTHRSIANLYLRGVQIPVVVAARERAEAQSGR